MRVFSAEAIAAQKAGAFVSAGSVWFATAEPFGLWSGFGDLTLDAGPGAVPRFQTYHGVGDRGLITVTISALGGAAQGASLSLSGVDPVVAASLDLRALRRVPVAIRRLQFNATGARLLDATVFMRGRVDTARLQKTPGGPSTVLVSVESAARGLGRRSERMRTDADQRLIDPTDGGMSRVTYAGEKIIYFGGQPPARASSGMPNGGYGGGGSRTDLSSQLY